jgi:hypothetical protein
MSEDVMVDAIEWFREVILIGAVIVITLAALTFLALVIE